MKKKLTITIICIVLLVVGTGIFVFATHQKEVAHVSTNSPSQVVAPKATQDAPQTAQVAETQPTSESQSAAPQQAPSEPSNPHGWSDAEWACAQQFNTIFPFVAADPDRAYNYIYLMTSHSGQSVCDFYSVLYAGIKPNLDANNGVWGPAYPPSGWLNNFGLTYDRTDWKYYNSLR